MSGIACDKRWKIGLHNDMNLKVILWLYLEANREQNCHINHNFSWNRKLFSFLLSTCMCTISKAYIASENENVVSDMWVKLSFYRWKKCIWNDSFWAIVQVSTQIIYMSYGRNEMLNNNEIQRKSEHKIAFPA